MITTHLHHLECMPRIQEALSFSEEEDRRNPAELRYKRQRASCAIRCLFMCKPPVFHADHNSMIILSSRPDSTAVRHGWMGTVGKNGVVCRGKLEPSAAIERLKNTGWWRQGKRKDPECVFPGEYNAMRVRLKSGRKCKSAGPSHLLSGATHCPGHT